MNVCVGEGKKERRDRRKRRKAAAFCCELPARAKAGDLKETTGRSVKITRSWMQPPLLPLASLSWPIAWTQLTSKSTDGIRVNLAHEIRRANHLCGP